MNQIYSKGSIIIFPEGSDFIVYNRRKSFKGGHTHINNLELAKHIVYLVANRIIDPSLNARLVDSCIRLTKDKVYKKNLELLKNKKERRQPYVNNSRVG
jgi:hypothetical protein